ncbi:MAG: hypothetical protein M5R40_15330 [Anaerolineae bacterium]|nr:hypothetical protein [Anaerolineae bacterium]
MLGMLMILVLIIVCLLVVTVGLDVACHNDIENWAPLYPNAEVVEMTYDGLFRPRAMGITWVTLLSPDPINDVRHWYYENLQQNIRDRTTRGIAQTDRWIEENPDGEGTLIYLSSSCAWY